MTLALGLTSLSTSSVRREKRKTQKACKRERKKALKREQKKECKTYGRNEMQNTSGTYSICFQTEERKIQSTNPTMTLALGLTSHSTKSERREKRKYEKHLKYMRHLEYVRQDILSQLGFLPNSFH